MNATEIFVYGTIWTAVWGAAVWFAKDKISNVRDRKKRTQHFLAFINVWESEVAADRRLQITNSSNVFVTVTSQFDARCLQLVEKATELEPNFRGTARIYFWSLVSDIKAMTPGGVEQKDGRQKLLEAIRNLAVFVRKN